MPRKKAPAPQVSVDEAPAMALEWWPIDRLQANPENYREHTPKQLQHLRASLRQRGWRKPVVARPSDGLLIAGHGITEAAKLEGMATVPVAPWECTDAQARAYLVADNATTRGAVDDEQALASLLAAIQADDTIEGVGFDDAELAKLLRQLEGGEDSDDDCDDGNAEIQRHKAALKRAALSSPIRELERLGYLDGSKSLFDYGCGKGDDLEALAELGVKCSGFDPYFAPGDATHADLVNLGFVVNVIESQAERADVLRSAFALAHDLLIVAVMTGKPPADQRPHGDGVRTSIGTFQRYYSQAEIQAYVTDTLGEAAVAVHGAGGGLVVAFPTRAAELDWQRRVKLAREAERKAGIEAVDDDPALALMAKWGTQTGQLWQLGPHRLLVGDSFNVDNLDRLFEGAEADAVITDPPFAIYGSSTGIGADIADDMMVRPFFANVVRACRARTKWFGHVYMFCDWRSWSGIWDAARREALSPANCLVWDKGGGGLGGMFANCHELIGFFVKVPPATAMRSTSARGQRMVYKPNIQRFNRAHGADRLHNAAKPLDLLGELIEAGTDDGQLVFDPFCGSGSTLIACGRSGRRCYTLDAQPKWAAVTLERWHLETGDRPALVDDGTEARNAKRKADAYAYAIADGRRPGDADFDDDASGGTVGW